MPEGVASAWGARAIFKEGKIELLADRTSRLGDVKQLMPQIQQAFKDVEKTAMTLYRTGRIDQTTEQTVVFYDQDGLVIEGNPRASFGYLYMRAYLKPKEA